MSKQVLVLSQKFVKIVQLVLLEVQTTPRGILAWALAHWRLVVHSSSRAHVELLNVTAKVEFLDIVGVLDGSIARLLRSVHLVELPLLRWLIHSSHGPCGLLRLEEVGRCLSLLLGLILLLSWLREAHVILWHWHSSLLSSGLRELVVAKLVVGLGHHWLGLRHTHHGVLTRLRLHHLLTKIVVVVHHNWVLHGHSHSSSRHEVSSLLRHRHHWLLLIYKVSRLALLHLLGKTVHVAHGDLMTD